MNDFKLQGVLVGNNVVLDCGANIGLFSNYAAAKGCRVYAFEPAKPTAGLFKLNQNIYPDQITLINTALHSQKGTKQFYTYEDDLGSYSTELKLGGSKGHTEYTQTISIDEFIKTNGLSRVDFIKADIEGAERYMLKGAQGVLKCFAPSLALCAYHMPDDKEILAELIIKANPNYHINHQWGKIYATPAEGNEK